MFRFLGFLIKTAFFAAIVLALGSIVRWNGQTVSDQIKTQVAHAERAADQVKSWGNNLTGKQSELDEISPSEREKLRALIRDLNHRRGNHAANKN